MSLLSLKHLSAGYGAGEVLHQIDIEVAEGEIALILGANGAGKTTTLRAISGTVRTKGEIAFDGKEIAGVAATSRVRRRIAHVPQGRGTFADLSVLDNLRLGAHLRDDRDGVASDLERWLAFFPRLRERRAQPAGELSGGEQQMLAIARAMMLRPRLLLLDEPSLGLSPILTQELLGRLRQLNEADRITMLIVEQNATLALAIASSACIMEAGRIVHRGSSDSLRDNDALRRSYLGY